MKSIKEKAKQVYRALEDDLLGTGENLQRREGFEAGANYVLDILEQALTPQKCLTDIGIDVCAEALVKTALQTIEQLKK